MKLDRLSSRLGRGTFLLVVALLTSGCCYQFGQGGCIEQGKTVSVPYIEGDRRGVFTNELVHAIATNGHLRMQQGCADYSLRVCLLPPTDTNIGFNYAKEKNLSKSNILVSREARLSICATLTLIECASGQRVAGPTEVCSSLDYDFESDFSRQGVDDFSIGQIQMHNLAKSSAMDALAKLLAEKIVDVVTFCW